MRGHNRKLAENIQARMTQMGLTVNDLSKRAGVDRASLFRLFSPLELHDPKLSTVQKIASALGCTVSDLAGDAKNDKD